jgi:hypothetical protein
LAGSDGMDQQVGYVSEEKRNMKMSNPVRKIVLAIHEYKNWVEVIISIAKRQKTTKLILRNGVQIEMSERLFWIVNDIFGAGTSIGAPAIDMSGLPHTIGRAIDLGPYAYQPSGSQGKKHVVKKRH